jgi:hypothetical protein
MPNLTLGADPELFLVDTSGNYIASCGLIGGTKACPLPLDIGQGFAVQEDNVALEYNIPASASKEMFTNNIALAMKYLGDMVRTKGLAFANTSSVSFPEEQLFHPLSREFGCDPDFDAWRQGRPNPRPKADDQNLRTCGGHVHIGHTFQSRKEILDFIKMMDLFTCVPSVLLDPQGARRRELYGNPGAFRFKPYGCEYRSLSNFWTLSPTLTDWVWDATSAAMNAWQNNTINVDDLADTIQNTIKRNDRAIATDLINGFNLVMP